MEFSIPNPDRFRISDCGHYLIEKHATRDGPRYSVWHYRLHAGGYESFEDACAAIMLREPQERADAMMDELIEKKDQNESLGLLSGAGRV